MNIPASIFIQFTPPEYLTSEECNAINEELARLDLPVYKKMDFRNQWEESLTQAELDHYLELSGNSLHAEEKMTCMSDDGTPSGCTRNGKFDYDACSKDCPLMQAYIKTEEAERDYMSSIGDRRCDLCRFYGIGDCAYCSVKDTFVRPSAKACPSFKMHCELDIHAPEYKQIKGFVTEEELIAKSEKHARDAAEETAHYINCERHIIKGLLGCPPTRDRIQKQYEKYPEIFATTPYKTYESLESAFCNE